MQNQLLSRFPAEALARWQPSLHTLHLDAGAVLHTAGSLTTHVYFPLDCVVSISLTDRDDKSLSVCLVGRDGLVGLHIILGTVRALDTSTVVIAGSALRLDAAALMAEFALGGEVAKLLLARTQAKVTHIAQAAYCSRHHSLDQHLCMRLLQMFDYSGRADLHLTQGRLAELLGGRREQVNRTLAQLREAGTLDIERNGLKLLDRQGLWQRVCACHAVLLDADARALATRF